MNSADESQSLGDVHGESQIGGGGTQIGGRGENSNVAFPLLVTVATGAGAWNCDCMARIAITWHSGKKMDRGRSGEPTIPARGEGSSGTNYDETVHGYDSRKRRIRGVTPGGTISRIVLDARGNAWKIYVGTNDNGATATDPTGGGASGNNMVLVTENEFDGGVAGGDNQLTQQTQYVSA